MAPTRKYPKKHNHGQRGMPFENLINKTNTMYRNQDLALINKRPTPIKVIKTQGIQIQKAKWDQKSTVDYDGLYHGVPIAFEAKSVQGKSFPLNMLQRHQLNYLQETERHGGEAFLLIEFRDQRTVFFTPVNMITLYEKQKDEGGRKSIPYDDFLIYADEVTPGRKVPLDYLAVLDRKQGSA